MEKEQIIPDLKRITIGRADDNDVVLAPTNIGRHHAIITVTGVNVYLLEDLNSKHGTYVDSNKIERKFISAEDQISFATNHYLAREILEMAKVIQPPKQSKGNDYSEEFEKMKIHWEQYETFQKNEVFIRDAIKRVNEHLRLGGALAAPTLAALSIVLGGPAVVATISACGLGMLIPAIGSKFLQEDEKLNQPKLHFAKNWKCPKCEDLISTGKSWETLARQKKCTKCDAIWVK